VRYLSDEWIAAVGRQLADFPAINSLALKHSVAVTQLVTASPFGDVTYHFTCRDGRLSFGKGPVPSDVTFTQDYDTAVGVATGKVNAADAFIKGLVRFSGDHQKVIDAQPLFAALDGVFASVRETTDYR
jgi:putative sterol carrier protein